MYFVIYIIVHPLLWEGMKEALSLFVLVNAVVYAEWGRADLDEAFGLVSSPTCLCLAIFAQLALRQVVDRINTYCLETIRTELQDSGTGDVSLAAG